MSTPFRFRRRSHWLVRKRSIKEGKFGQGLEGCIRADAEEAWEELSGLRGGRSEAWRWEHARCILGTGAGPV